MTGDQVHIHIEDEITVGDLGTLCAVFTSGQDSRCRLLMLAPKMHCRWDYPHATEAR